MPKIEVNLRPETGASELMEIFRDKFPQYTVFKPAMFGVDFALRKSAWTAVSVKLVRKTSGTFIRLSNFIPSMSARFFLGGLLAYIILLCTSWPKMMKEVREFVETAPEFKAG